MKANTNGHVCDIGKTILIPLTQSLYVPGTLEDPGNVLVDVGTGYYVEKTTEKAIAFYNDKIKTVGNNLDDLEKIITQKTQNVKVVEDGKLSFNRIPLEVGCMHLLTGFQRQYYDRRFYRQMPLPRLHNQFHLSLGEDDSFMGISNCPIVYIEKYCRSILEFSWILLVAVARRLPVMNEKTEVKEMGE